MFMIFHHSVMLTKSWEHISLETVKNVSRSGRRRKEAPASRAGIQRVCSLNPIIIYNSMFKTILNFASMRPLDSLESNTV